MNNRWQNEDTFLVEKAINRKNLFFATNLLNSDFSLQHYDSFNVNVSKYITVATSSNKCGFTLRRIQTVIKLFEYT